MRSVLIIFVFAALLSCSENDPSPTPFKDLEWKKLGLEGKIVNEIQLYEDVLYAATDDGLYKKSISEESEDFSLVNFAGKNVSAIVFLNNQQVFAAVNGKLFHSENAGNTWQEVSGDFGGEEEEAIHDIAAAPGGALYATGVWAVAKSENDGLNWQPEWGYWGGFGTGTDVVAVNPHRPTEIWAGGQGGIENGFLLKSPQGEEEEWTEWFDLVENPTVVKEIIFDGEDADKVYVGWEGKLIATENSGETWETLIDEMEEVRFFFGIAKSTRNNAVIFAGGWLKRFDDPQPLILYYSTNDGETWKQVEHPSENLGGIYDMKVLSESGRERVFAGTYKGGVYEIIVPADML